MKSKLQKTRLVFALGIVLIIGCFLYFWFVVPYHICFKEQIQLFVFSSSYVSSYLSKPAIFARLAGDFLTQFFYFRIVGATIITLLLIAIWCLTFLSLKQLSVTRTLHIETSRTIFLRCTVSLIPVIITWIYFPNPSFSASWVVSFIIALSAFIIYAKTNGKTAVALGIILIPTLYIIAGTSVFLFVILAILYKLKMGGNRKFFILHSLFFILLAVITPFILRHTYLLTLKQAYLYPYSKIKQGYILNMEQENLFGIMIEAYHENWDEVLEIAKKSELKSPIATCYANIALSKKSLLGDQLMEFYQPFSTGLLLPVTPGSSWLSIFSSSDGYYHIGDIGMAQYAAMLGMLFSPNQRSARMMERLVETNIAAGDTAVAVKYIRTLESTLFHKIKSEKLKNLQQQASFQEDRIRNASDIKLSLELLVESNPNNMQALNYLLCYYLLNKDIPAFFKTYTTYGKEKFTSVPKVYAEALLIYFAVKGGTMQEITSYRIDSEIVKAFREYSSLYEKSKGNLAPMQKNFPNTYWLFYHFATMNN